MISFAEAVDIVSRRLGYDAGRARAALLSAMGNGEIKTSTSQAIHGPHDSKIIITGLSRIRAQDISAADVARFIATREFLISGQYDYTPEQEADNPAQPEAQSPVSSAPPLSDDAEQEEKEAKARAKGEAGAQQEDEALAAEQAKKPWLIYNPSDPEPEYSWYTPARFFARALVKKDPTLLGKRDLLAMKVADALGKVGCMKRGGKKPFDPTTVKKAFANVDLGV